jgi:YihY family inner membrane protein
VTIRRLVTLAQKAFEGYSRDNCAQMAAAITYHILFFSVPVVMFIVSAVGLTVGTETVQQRLTDYISENLDLTTTSVTLELTDSGTMRLENEFGPQAPSDVTAELDSMNTDPERGPERGTIADGLLDAGSAEVAGYEILRDDVQIHFDNIVLDTLRNVVDSSGTLGIISLLVLGYAASGLFGQVRRSLDYVWGQRLRRPFVPGKLMDVALLFVLVLLLLALVLLLFALSIASSIMVRIVTHFSPENLGWLDGAPGIVIGIGAPFLFSFILFTLLYRFGPRASVTFRQVWLGALLAAVGFELLKFGYGIYITNFSSFDVVYGALGGVLLFLLFVFLSSQVFLFGAEVSYHHPAVMHGDYDEGPSATGPTSIEQRVRSAVRSLFVNPPDE